MKWQNGVLFFFFLRWNLNILASTSINASYVKKPKNKIITSTMVCRLKRVAHQLSMRSDSGLRMSISSFVFFSLKTSTFDSKNTKLINKWHLLISLHDNNKGLWTTGKINPPHIKARKGTPLVCLVWACMQRYAWDKSAPISTLTMTLQRPLQSAFRLQAHLALFLA